MKVLFKKHSYNLKIQIDLWKTKNRAIFFTLTQKRNCLQFALIGPHLGGWAVLDSANPDLLQLESRHTFFKEYIILILLVQMVHKKSQIVH